MTIKAKEQPRVVVRVIYTGYGTWIVREAPALESKKDE